MSPNRVKCDGCGVDLGSAWCYNPHQYGDYDALCDTCFKAMKDDPTKRFLVREGRAMRGQADDAGPDLPLYGESKLVESVLAILEEAGCPTPVNHQIVMLIEAWERQQEGSQG